MSDYKHIRSYIEIEHLKTMSYEEINNVLTDQKNRIDKLESKRDDGWVSIEDVRELCKKVIRFLTDRDNTFYCKDCGAEDTSYQEEFEHRDDCVALLAKRLLKECKECELKNQ